MKFILTCKDDALKQRFYDCCNQSVARGQKFAPKGRDEIDQLIQEVIPELTKIESPELEQVNEGNTQLKQKLLNM